MRLMKTVSPSTRKAEHHHVSPFRLAELDDLPVRDGQPDPVGELVDGDEVADEERGHHRTGRNAERLDHERADDEDGQEDGKERPCVLDDGRHVPMPVAILSA